MVLVRIKLKSEGGDSTSPFNVASEIYKSDGVKVFFRGLDSAILRQVVYGTLHLGVYFNLTEKWKRKSGQNTTNA
jgi:solute carrier family 25 oxoglutarate transporter 11